MSEVSIEEINLLHLNICQAIGEPRRIQILYALNEGPLNVTALAEKLDTPQPTISRHLAVLRQRALVTSERDGTSVTYSISTSEIIEVLNSMRQLLRHILELQANVLD